MTNYDGVLRILEELMMELLKKGLTIPQQVIDDLKAGRTLINVQKASTEDPDTDMKITSFLQTAEANLLSLAEMGMGKEYADAWQNKINGAYREEGGKSASPSKFISGVPKGEHWIRIKSSELAAAGELSELLRGLNLLASEQEDGYLLIHGRKEDVSAFLKEIRQKVGKSNVPCKN